jgi:predicted transcriptional regulator
MIQHTVFKEMGSVGVLDNSSTKLVYKRNFRIDVINRILAVLDQNGPMKKTNLAGRAGLNYDTCVKYVNLLKLLNWIDVIVNDTEYVIITPYGKQIYDKFSGDMV